MVLVLCADLAMPGGVACMGACGPLLPVHNASTPGHWGAMPMHLGPGPAPPMHGTLGPLARGTTQLAHVAPGCCLGELCWGGGGAVPHGELPL